MPAYYSADFFLSNVISSSDIILFIYIRQTDILCLKNRSPFPFLISINRVSFENKSPLFRSQKSLILILKVLYFSPLIGYFGFDPKVTAKVLPGML